MSVNTEPQEDDQHWEDVDQIVTHTLKEIRELKEKGDPKWANKLGEQVASVVNNIVSSNSTYESFLAVQVLKGCAPLIEKLPGVLRKEDFIVGSGNRPLGQFLTGVVESSKQGQASAAKP